MIRKKYSRVYKKGSKSIIILTKIVESLHFVNKEYQYRSVEIIIFSLRFDFLIGFFDRFMIERVELVF